MRLAMAAQLGSLADAASKIRRLGLDGRAELSAVLNAAGDRVRLLTIAAEAKQIGLPEKTLAKAQRAKPSTAASLSYRIRADGGNIRLKYFDAGETPSGVLAHPLGNAQVFDHTFMKGGRFPNRVTVTKLNGQVFRRKDGAGRKLEVVRSGVAIPTEMVKGDTAAAFDRGVATIVARSVVIRLGALAP